MTALTLALAQCSPRVGDLLTNAKNMLQLAQQAQQQGADVIVFPELALTGYPPEDLLLRPSLSKRIAAAFEILKQATDITLVVGFPDTHDNKRFNAASIISNGKVLGTYHKHTLPNYGVFDERRYFDTGSQHVMLNIKGQKLGLLICEDIWQPEPIAQLKSLGANCAIVLNASPFETNKHQHRKTLLSQQAKQNQLPIAYVNSVGGQDDLVFDGGSLAVNTDGTTAAEAHRFTEQLLLVQFDATQQQFVPQAPVAELSTYAEMYQALVVAVRDYVNNSGFPGVILGLSGGIDSALSLAIAVDALGANRVNAVMMPFSYTAKISLEDAEAQAKRLKTAYHVAEIHDIVHSFGNALYPFFGEGDAGTAEENIQARARGTLLMALSNKFGHLVLTTGNKSEMAVGYATLYGDMAGGFDVLKDVYKTQVFALARYRNSLEESPVIPERVISRPPSAELRPDQKDQDSLPDYELLDAILHAYIEQDLSLSDLVDKGFDHDIAHKIITLVDRNEYKRRQAAIGPRMSARAFGRERRYPLVSGWTAGE